MFDINVIWEVRLSLHSQSCFQAQILQIGYVDQNDSWQAEGRTTAFTNNSFSEVIPCLSGYMYVYFTFWILYCMYVVDGELTKDPALTH